MCVCVCVCMGRGIKESRNSSQRGSSILVSNTLYTLYMFFSLVSHATILSLLGCLSVDTTVHSYLFLRDPRRIDVRAGLVVETVDAQASEIVSLCPPTTPVREVRVCCTSRVGHTKAHSLRPTTRRAVSGEARWPFGDRMCDMETASWRWH